MAVVNSIKTVLPAATPTEYVKAEAVALTVGTVITALTGFMNYLRSGIIRFKVTVPNGGQITAIKITGTDGTLTVTLYQDTIARTANENVDFNFEFVSDLNLTTINVAVTVATATMTADMEVTGNP